MWRRVFGFDRSEGFSDLLSFFFFWLAKIQLVVTAFSSVAISFSLSLSFFFFFKKILFLGRAEGSVLASVLFVLYKNTPEISREVWKFY